MCKFLVESRKGSSGVPLYSNGPMLGSHEGPQKKRHDPLQRPYVESPHRAREVALL